MVAELNHRFECSHQFFRRMKAAAGAGRALATTAASTGLVSVPARIIWCVVAVWPHFKWVAIAQGPYFVWVSLATMLQLSITWMNR